MVGNNLKAHLDALEKQMRDAAADLDFEKAARLRDEIKRLREMELAISDDPLAQICRFRKPGLGPREGQAQQGPRHPPRGRRECADARRRRARSASAPPPGRSLFAKPSIDDMGPGTDATMPAGAVSRSLFRKQSHARRRTDRRLWRCPTMASQDCSARTRSTK